MAVPANKQMHCVVRDSIGFNSVVEAMKDLVKPFYLQCNGDGLMIKTTDTSNVAMIIMQMKEPFFEDYTCEKSFKVGINMESMHRVMGMCSPTDLLMLAGARVVVLICQASDGSRFLRTAFEDFGVGGEGFLWLGIDAFADAGLWGEA